MARGSYLSQRLYECRKAAKLNVDEVGAMIGRSGKTISAWEVGTSEPNAELMIALCKAYGVSISYFFPPDVLEGGTVAEDERELVALYRTLTKRERESVLSLVSTMADKGLAKNNHGSAKAIA